MTDYTINVAMSQDTVDELQNEGFRLYGFKGVQTTIGGGAPVVWFETQTYSIATQITWLETYQAYTSLSAIVPSGQIKASAAYDIDLGQTLQVTGQAGTGQVAQGGTPGAISIQNTISTKFTCGVSQVQNVNGKPTPTPLCAFPLHGNGLDAMAPIELVLLMFATPQINTGTVIYKAFSQGVLINLTGSTERDVSYDIDKGWTWGGGAWAQTVPADAALSPLLIDQTVALGRRVVEAQNAASRLVEPSDAPQSRNGTKPRSHARA